MLKLLGFFNIDSVPAPVIPGYIGTNNEFQVVSGYGLQLTSRAAYTEFPLYDANGQILPNGDQPVYDPLTMRFAPENITLYTLKAYNLGGNGIQEFVPTIPESVTVLGHFGNNVNIGEPSPFLSTLYQANAANSAYIRAPPGYTLTGSGILPPAPQILTNQNTGMGYAYQRIICTRSNANPDNFRWNFDNVTGNGLQPTEIGIWGVFYDPLAFTPMPNNGAPPAGIQIGMPVTFQGNGLGDPNAYLTNNGGVNDLTCNLYSKIIQSAQWRLVGSGFSGQAQDREDWIYCMELTTAPQSTVPVNLPDRMINEFGTGIVASLNPLIGTINPAQWLIAQPAPASQDPKDYMGYYNLQFQYNRLSVNSPQLVTSIDANIVYTNMLATNVGLNDLTSVLIPQNLTNLEGLDEIHIHCAQLRTKHLASTSFQPLAPSDVIGVVPVDVPFGSKGTWQPPVPLESYITNTNVVNLDFRLTDSANRPLDFNGLDWSMVFNCQEVDVISPEQMGGTINTPFQDQLATLESTAHAETRAMRKRGGGGMLPLEFYDKNSKTMKSGYSK
jgi:hypothetical protein